MNQTGAVVGGDVVGEDHVVGVGNLDEVEWPVVGDALELRSLEDCQLGGAVAEER